MDNDPLQIAVIATYDARGLEQCLLETDMLTIDQKETILRRAGVTVPAFPEGHADGHPRDHAADAEHKARVQRWSKAVEVLYVQYAAARAAKSLRDAEEAARLDQLRRAAERST
jgi:hypothetical protein